MTKEGIELEIERAWGELTTMRCDRQRTIYLTTKGTLTHGFRGVHSSGEEVGTYTRAVTLAAFRDDVFHVFESMRRVRCL